MWNSFNVLMFVITLANGLCCALFMYPILCCSWCPEIGTRSIDWAQLSSFHLKTETESSLQWPPKLLLKTTVSLLIEVSDILLIQTLLLSGFLTKFYF
jgi:hypothetical protein